MFRSWEHPSRVGRVSWFEPTHWVSAPITSLAFGMILRPFDLIICTGERQWRGQIQSRGLLLGQQASSVQLSRGCPPRRPDDPRPRSSQLQLRSEMVLARSGPGRSR